MGPISEQNNGNEPTQSSEQGAQGEESPDASRGERAASGNTSAQNREIVHGDSLRDTYLRIRIRGAQGSVDAQQSVAREKPSRNRRGQGRLQQPQEAALLSPAATSEERLKSSSAGSVPLAGVAGRQHTEEVILPGHEQQTIMSGAGLGRRYVRRRLPSQSETSAFLPRGEQVFEATEGTLQPQSQIGRGYERVRRVLLGRRLTTAEQVHERLTKVKALAVLSSDAISSVAYATEASLAILIGAGTAALTQNLPITACIVLLMIIVGVSYRQTIHAYPSGGGSYIVARDNLGVLPGLIAAAALLIDYVLTV